MLYPIYGPIAAVPRLHLQLQHIARSPAARLGISYQIVPHRYCHPPLRDVLALNVRRGVALRDVELATLIAARSPRAPIGPDLCLGEEIFLMNMWAGGIDGQPLPMSICMRMERYTHPQPPLGMLADMVA